MGVALAALLLLLTAPLAGEDDPGFELVEVAAGVHAAIKSEALRFQDSNAVILVNDRDVVVIDTQASEADVAQLIDALRALTDKPVRYVVNTHWHGDHTRGNSTWLAAFPGAEIIGHESLLEDLPQRAEPQLAEEIETYRGAIAGAEKNLAAGLGLEGEALEAPERADLDRRIEKTRRHLVALEAARFVPPTLTLRNRLILHRGERVIDIRHVRAHTRGDVVVHLPRERILITGDILDDLPYGGHGYPRDWIQVLDELADLDFTRVVPGHGGIRTGREHLGAVRAWLVAIVAAAESGHEAGKSLEGVLRSVDLEAHRERLAGDDPVANRAFEQFTPATLERAWLEARGESDG